MEDNESNRYEKIKFLGEGQVRLQAIELDTVERGQKTCRSNPNFFRSIQFATVFKSRDVETGQIVAVKKVSQWNCLPSYENAFENGQKNAKESCQKF